MDGSQFAGLVNLLDTSKYIKPEDYPPQDRDLIAIVRKIRKEEYTKYIAKNSPFGDLWENIVQSNTTWTQESKDLLYDYLHPKLIKLFSSIGLQNPLYLLPKTSLLKLLL